MEVKGIGEKLFTTLKPYLVALRPDDALREGLLQRHPRKLRGNEELPATPSRWARDGDLSARPEPRPRLRAFLRDGYSTVEILVILAMLAAATAVAAPGAIAAAGGRTRSGRPRLKRRSRFFRPAPTRLLGSASCGIEVSEERGPVRMGSLRGRQRQRHPHHRHPEGVDRPLGIALPWDRNDVMPGIMKGSRVPDPGNPGHALGNLDDPIRFNSSDICSFSPVGEARRARSTCGMDTTGWPSCASSAARPKVRTLYYRRGDREWKP